MHKDLAVFGAVIALAGLLVAGGIWAGAAGMFDHNTVKSTSTTSITAIATKPTARPRTPIVRTMKDEPKAEKGDAKWSDVESRFLELVQDEKSASKSQAIQGQKQLAPDAIYLAREPIQRAEKGDAAAVLHYLSGEQLTAVQASHAYRYLQVLAVSQSASKQDASLLPLLKKVWAKIHGDSPVPLSRVRAEAEWVFDACLRLSILDELKQNELAGALHQFASPAGVKLGVGQGLGTLDDFQTITAASRK